MAKESASHADGRDTMIQSKRRTGDAHRCPEQETEIVCGIDLTPLDADLALLTDGDWDDRA